jgi:hypothetical protein
MVREAEHPCVDAHERGGALPVVGAASALAEGTAGVEPAGKAEIATAAKLEALVPWAQGEPGREVDSLLQGDRVTTRGAATRGLAQPRAIAAEGRAQTSGAATKARMRECPNEGKTRTRSQGAAAG